MTNCSCTVSHYTLIIGWYILLIVFYGTTGAGGQLFDFSYCQIYVLTCLKKIWILFGITSLDGVTQQVLKCTVTKVVTLFFCPIILSVTVIKVSLCSCTSRFVGDGVFVSVLLHEVFINLVVHGWFLNNLKGSFLFID